MPTLLAQPYLPGFPLGARIPAISGRVIDAVTGRPIANLDVTLRATSATGSLGDGSGVDALRYENVVTSKKGEFNFKTSLETEVAKPLTSLKEYWLSVNRKFVSIAQLNARLPDWGGSATIDTTSDDYSWDLAGDPLFKRRGELDANGALRLNNRAYFPIAVQFVGPCKQMWNANCIYLSDAKNVTVPLIPVMDNPEGCRRIGDPALREQCRQLNTYRAAFLHVETIPEVRADKELCRQVDQGPVSKKCLERLGFYVQQPDVYENRAPLRMEFDPKEQALILSPIAGMSVSQSSVNSLNPFRETVGYYACYSLQKSLMEAACARVLWSGIKQELHPEYFVGGEGYKKGMEQHEVIDGNNVVTVDVPKTFGAVWLSGSHVVSITFYHAAYWMSGRNSDEARAAEASPEAKREFIRRYLQKYPSSQ